MSLCNRCAASRKETNENSLQRMDARLATTLLSLATRALSNSTDELGAPDPPAYAVVSPSVFSTALSWLM